MGELPHSHVRLAVAECLRDPSPKRRELPKIIRRLWREDPNDVAAAYDTMIFGGLDMPEPGGRLGLKVERMRELHRPLPFRRKTGMRLPEIAAEAGMTVGTLKALMVHHGYLELVPFGGRQNRHLVTEQAFLADLGHNVDPSHQRSTRLDGASCSAVFPVFYPQALPDVLWTLDWSGIRDAVSSLGKRQKLRRLCQHHAYLPVASLVELSGYSRDGVEKALRRGSTPRADEGPQTALYSMTTMQTFDGVSPA